MTLEQLPSTGLLTSSEEIVAGIITTNTPTIVKGAGSFTVAKNSTGNITITFTTAFSDTPRVISNASGAGDRSTSIFSVSTTGVSVIREIASTGGVEDGDIHFVAYIPSTTKTRIPKDFGLVTALPTAQMGDQCTYTDSLTAPTYTWRLMYDASQVAANKWIFVGGSPLATYNSAQVTTTSASYATPTGGQLTLTLPLAGDYDIWGSARLGNSAANFQNWSYAVGALAASDDWCCRHTGGTMAVSMPTPEYRHLARSVSDIVSEKVLTTGGTANYTARSLRVRPVRVG